MRWILHNDADGDTDRSLTLKDVHSSQHHHRRRTTSRRIWMAAFVLALSAGWVCVNTRSINLVLNMASVDFDISHSELVESVAALALPTTATEANEGEASEGRRIQQPRTVFLEGPTYGYAFNARGLQQHQHPSSTTTQS